MSVRSAPPQRHNRRTVRRAALVALCAVACGLMATPAGAQPKTPTKEDDVGKNLGKLDPNNPVDADGPRRPAVDKYTFDSKGRIFNKVEDFKPVANEVENSDEYQAWVALVLHAKRFPTAELERAGARDLTPIDLIRSNRSVYRYELLRFVGKAVCARRLPAPKYFTDFPELGIKEMYEVRFVPTDDSPLTPVSIVFLDLPKELAAVKAKPEREWLDLPNPTYLEAAGFYFKTMSAPPELGATPVGVPLLVGKSVTPLAGHPVPYDTDPTALDRNVRLYKFIKDEAAMIRATPGDSDWAEVAAFNRVIIHAHRFTAEQLEEKALIGVKFADLFEEVRRDYKLKNVKFEGRIIRYKRMEVNPELKAAGIDQAFEAWLVPKDEPRGNPICVVFTEPVPDLEPGDRVNKWVTFAGFSFKKMRYQSAEDDPKNPGKKLDKYAPLLIGKGPVVRPDPERDTPLTWGAFVKWAIIAGVLLVLGGLLITRYFLRGDRQARAEIENVRGRNPFDANAPAAPTALTDPNAPPGPAPAAHPTNP